MRWMVLVAVVGCDDAGSGGPGKSGKNGGDGADGLTGPAGAPAGAYRWHDADGEQVTDGPDLHAFDDDENVWMWDVETAELVPSAFAQLFFADRGCSGTELVTAIPPRFVISGEYWGSDALYARPDGLREDGDCAQSTEYDGGYCGVIDLCTPLVRLDDLVRVDPPPSSGYEPPLHPEPL